MIGIIIEITMGIIIGVDIWRFPLINRGTRIAGWFIRWKIQLKWMMTRGIPLFQKPPYGGIK